MRYNLRYFIAAGLIGIILVASSCAKKLDDAYANPNANVRQPIEVIFPSLIGSLTGSSSAAGSAYGLCGDALLIGRYIQYWGSYIVNNGVNLGTQYDKMGGVSAPSDNLGSMWGSYYYGMGQNITRIIEWGTEEEKWDFVGAAWALRAWGMLETANEYGDMIQKEAFNTSLQVFKYDEQSEVYDSVRATCHRAIEFLSRSGGGMNPTSFAASDAYFNTGNLERWKKFTYGILARSFAYIHNKPSYNADSVITYADLSITTNADNATAKFASTGITGTSNYYGTFRGNVNNTSTGIRQSAFIANLMTGANAGAFTGVSDPRVLYMLRENTNGTVKGITPWLAASGLVAADQPQNFMGTSFGTVGYPGNETTNRYIFRNGAEFPIMTASEILFIKAEAALRKGLFPVAMTAYTTAISLNFDMLSTKYNINIPAGKEITPVNKAAYLADVNIVPTDPTKLTLTRIMLQKYIALYAWGVQSTWADMRRYHYNVDIDPGTTQPVYVGFSPPTGSDLFIDNAGKVVQRCRPRYNSEYLYNIPELTRIGAVLPNYHTKEQWFSIKP